MHITTFILMSWITAGVVLSYPDIISRSDWGAQSASKYIPNLKHPVEYAVIHHTASSSCSTIEKCKTYVRNTQSGHIDDPEIGSDIAYNFLVDKNGNVYEGRGWDKVGYHCGDWGINSNSIGIAVIGNFMTREPSAEAQDAVKSLLEMAVYKRKLDSTYKLRGHRDVNGSACPGDKFYNLIKLWPHFNN
ncbi:peptidoglycan recognition protein 1-like [Mercenaria mercenaria]|uniref:peptidoglycan recognition protein 1-like n=1 Tax=Mercenaria mercenaria TaxID=6596 RepID=UPI00234E630C|nr:peptidoglycan recognition protein 1-like [Mercenaria mercenaria]